MTSRALPAVRPSGTSIWVSSAVVRTPWAAPRPDHRLGQHARLADVLHEGAGADLHVEHQRLGALGDLLRHDRAGDQRDRLDRAGDVTEGVELAVRGREVGAGGVDDRAGGGRGSAAPRRAQRRSPAGDRLHLVERAAGVAQASAGGLGHRGAARGDERAQDQRDLVADAAGGVLVDGGASERRSGRRGCRWRSSARSTAPARPARGPGTGSPSAGPTPARRRRRRRCTPG